MNLRDIEQFSPSGEEYSLTDKLMLYVTKKSEKAFAFGDEIRRNIKNKDDFISYQNKMRGVIKESVGEIPYDKDYPLNVENVGKIEREDYTIEKIIFTARKNSYITANVYVPKKYKGKRPGILFQCGHDEEGKNGYGKLAGTLAKAGNVVLIFDPVGQGERAGYVENNNKEEYVEVTVTEHQYFGNQCFLAGETPVKYFIADAMRSIDYLVSRSDVDSSKIGLTGSSGGGTMTSLVMNFDDRVRAAAPGTFITSRRAYFYAGGAQDAEQIWPDTTNKGFDHFELISMFCPKPIMILAVRSDFFPVEGTIDVKNQSEKFYKLMDKEENFHIVFDDSEHHYTDYLIKKACEFFAEVFQNEKIDTSNILATEENPLSILNCTKSGRLRFEKPDYLIPFSENKKVYEEKIRKKKTKEEVKEFLKDRIYNEREIVPFNVRHFKKENCEGLITEKLMWFSQYLMPCYGVMFKNYDKENDNLPVEIMLWHKGTDRIIEKMDTIRKICNEGKTAFVVDLTAMGKNEPHSLNYLRDIEGFYGMIEKFSKDLFFIGDSLCALKSFDLIRTIEMIKEEFKVEDISVYTEGNYSVFSDIIKVFYEDIKVTNYNKVTLKDIITNKYYTSYNSYHIIMPGLGLYIE